MTKAHPHAALMLQYAQDAADTETPWERWEWRSGNSRSFEAFFTNPSWNPMHVYRRKIQQTITVNGFEVPAPVKEAEDGQFPLWVATPDHPQWAFSSVHQLRWPPSEERLKRGLLHTTKEAAVAHAKAMLGIDPKGE